MMTSYIKGTGVQVNGLQHCSNHVSGPNTSMYGFKAGTLHAHLPTHSPYMASKVNTKLLSSYKGQVHKR